MIEHPQPDFMVKAGRSRHTDSFYLVKKEIKIGKYAASGFTSDFFGLFLSWIKNADQVSRWIRGIFQRMKSAEIPNSDNSYSNLLHRF